MLARRPPLRGKANETARDGSTRCEASCASIAMSEILAEDSSRRPPGHVRRLPRQLSFFGFQGDDNQDSINRVRSNRCVACLLGFAPTVLIIAYVGGLSEGANGLRKTLQQTRLGGSRKSIRSGIGSCFGTSPVGCSCVISWRKRNCSSCAIRVVLRSEFIGMEPGIYRGVSNLKQTSLDAETAPLSPEAVLPD